MYRSTLKPLEGSRNWGGWCGQRGTWSRSVKRKKADLLNGRETGNREKTSGAESLKCLGRSNWARVGEGRVWSQREPERQYSIAAVHLFSNGLRTWSLPLVSCHLIWYIFQQASVSTIQYNPLLHVHVPTSQHNNGPIVRLMLVKLGARGYHHPPQSAPCSATKTNTDLQEKTGPRRRLCPKRKQSICVMQTCRAQRWLTEDSEEGKEEGTRAVE